MASGESLKNKPYRQPVVFHAGPFVTNRALERERRRRVQRMLTEIRMRERSRDLVPKG
jgi:hypothetical protein